MIGHRVQGVVLDWAGTVVDHGCLAPVGVFVEVFRQNGVEVSVARAREPMGTHKREHIRRVAAMPEVAAAWEVAHGRLPTDEDVDRMYAQAEPLQIACLPQYATPITGAVEAVAQLRSRGLKIGSTTGYNRAMLDVLAEAAAAQGYSPDCAVAASEVGEGRPAPFLSWEAARRIGVWPVWTLVNVGDTVVDVHSGRNAGMWSIGVSATGNLVGLSEADWNALAPTERLARTAVARDALTRAGAHLVVDHIGELPDAIEHINGRIVQGQRP